MLASLTGAIMGDGQAATAAVLDDCKVYINEQSSVKGKIFQIVPSDDPLDFIDSPESVSVGEIHWSYNGLYIEDNAFKAKYGSHVIYMMPLSLELDGNEIVFGHIVLFKNKLILVPTKNIDTLNPYLGI